MAEKFPSGRPTIPAPKNPYERQEGGLKVSAVSIPKNPDEKNEDSALELHDADGTGETLVVADGMGGYAGGEIASRLVVDVVAAMNKEFLDIQRRRREGKIVGPGMTNEMEVARRMIIEANKKILDARKNDPPHEKMGTTAVIVRLVEMDQGRWEGIAVVVGDSRAYLQYQDGSLETLSLDGHPLMLIVKGRHGRDAAMRTQSILDRLESYREFAHLKDLIKKNEPWPERSSLVPSDIVFLEHMIDPMFVEDYFHGTISSRTGEGFYRSYLRSSIPYDPKVDAHHFIAPPGGKVILSSDADDVLTIQEREAVLSDPDGFDVDPMLMHLAGEGRTPAERYAKAIRGRMDGVAMSPRTRGEDDISVIVAEIPKRTP